MKRFLITAVPALLTLACIATTPTTAQMPTAEATSTPALNITSSMMETLGPLPDPETPAPGMVSVWVFFAMAGDDNMTPVPAARSVVQTDSHTELIRLTLEELLKGPTDAEKAAGMNSWFSAGTAHALSGVLENNNEYTVLFSGLNTLIPNASTSAGSQMLISQLNSTMFQFGFVGSVIYTLEGDCGAFWEWLQMGCHTVTRAEWEAG